MEDDRVGHRENEQHPYRRETHLALAADVVTDEIAGAQQQLSQLYRMERERDPKPHMSITLWRTLCHPMGPKTARCEQVGQEWPVKVSPQLLQRCSSSLLTYRIGSRCQRLKRAYCSFKECQLAVI